MTHKRETLQLGLDRPEILLQLKETTGGEFRVYRASIRLLQGIWIFYKAPITMTAHLKMS